MIRNIIERPMPPWIPYLMLLSLAVGVNFVAMPGDFFMDDLVIVRFNPLVNHPSLQAIFLTDYWGPSESTGLYRPLTILSFVINRMVFGHVAWGYHLVNILLHAAVTILLYLLLGRIGVVGAVRWLAAAVFAVHPIHGEAVNELVGRSELQVALFVLLGLFLARGGGRWRLTAIAACFLGALLSKEHGIVFLVLLPVTDFFLDREPVKVLRQRRSLYALLTGIAIAWLLFRDFGVQRPPVGLRPELDPIFVPLSTLDFSARVLAALKVQVLYLAKLFIPCDLQGMYPPSTVLPSAPFASLWTLAIVAVLLLLAVAIWQGWRRRQFWGLAVVLYVVSFVPTSNLLVLTEVTMAERLAYLPSLWFCLGLASAIFFIPVIAERRTQVVIVSLVLTCIYSAFGIARSLDFRSPERLWTNDLKINPANELSMLFLADELWRQARLTEAEGVLERLTGLSPSFSDALRTYACLLLDMDRPKEAIDYAKRAIAAGGRSSAAYMPLADAYIDTGRLDLAYETLEKGRGAHQDRAIYWEVLGKYFQAKGDLVGAVECYEKALTAYGPWSDDTIRRLGVSYLELGHYGKAEELLRRDLVFNKNAEGYNNLGTALALQGRREEARASFAKAVELQPDSLLYRANLERSRQ